MILFITIFILALLVPVIKIDGIDQPQTLAYKRASSEGYPTYNFILPRGQPGFRASIINTNKPLPRNKGEPNSRATIIRKTQHTTPRNKGEPTNST
jgi:hypothetical protein